MGSPDSVTSARLIRPVHLNQALRVVEERLFCDADSYERGQRGGG
jgi:hypothetical protein